jgi:hypothetical protein
VALVADLDGDLADRLLAGDRHGGDVADQALGRGDLAGDPRELAGFVRDAQPEGAVERHAGKLPRMPLPRRNLELKAVDPDPPRTLGGALALDGAEDARGYAELLGA